MGLRSGPSPKMVVKTLASLLAFTVCCQGAAILSENDEWFEAAQRFLMDPEPLVTALGAQRVKREAGYDKEFTVGALGVGFGIKYTDPSNPMKGGKAYSKFPLKKFVPRAQSEMVDLQMSFDGGDAVDGLFTMSVDYTLTHSDGSGIEKGTFTLSRKKVGGLWKTELSTSSAASFPSRIIPLFSITAESDRKTMMHSAYKGTYGSLTFNVDRVPGEKLAAEIDFNGKKYSFTVTIDKAAMEADVEIKAAENSYKLTAKVSKTDSWKLKITGDVMGAVDATMLIKKDFSEAKIEISHKNAKMLQMRLKGSVNPDGSFKAKAKFSLMGGRIATGDIDASFADNTFNTVVKPNNFDAIDLTFYFKPSYTGGKYAGTTFGYEAKKGGVSMSKYDVEHKRVNDASKYDASLKTNLQLNEKSFLYNPLCRIANNLGSKCFKQRTVELTGFIDKVQKNKLLNKFAFGLKNTKDGETRLDVSVSTLKNPYELKIVSPRLQPKIGSNELTITADHKPGKELTILSSYQQFKFFFKHGMISNGKNFFAEISKGGESFLKYDMDLTFKANPSVIEAGLKSQFDVNEASLFYPLFCSYGSGCFKQRKANIGFFVDRVNKNALLNKFDFHADVTKDAEKVFQFEFSTKNSPYKFVVKAPYILPNLIGQQSVEIETTHNLGQSLEVSTNIQKAKSFSIRKTSGNMREVRFNGKLLFKGEVTPGNKSFKQQIELANGQSMSLTVSWENNFVAGSGMSANGIKCNLAGNNLNADSELGWDISNPADGKLEFEIKGTGPRLGNFEFSRDFDWNIRGDKLIANIIGKSSSQKGWFAEKGLSPVDTKINIDFDVHKTNLNAKLVKVVNGMRYAVGVKDNNLDISF